MAFAGYWDTGIRKEKHANPGVQEGAADDVVMHNGAADDADNHVERTHYDDGAERNIPKRPPAAESTCFLYASTSPNAFPVNLWSTIL